MSGWFGGRTSKPSAGSPNNVKKPSTGVESTKDSGDVNDETNQSSGRTEVDEPDPHLSETDETEAPSPEDDRQDTPSRDEPLTNDDEHDSDILANDENGNSSVDYPTGPMSLMVQSQLSDAMKTDMHNDIELIDEPEPSREKLLASHKEVLRREVLRQDDLVKGLEQKIEILCVVHQAELQAERNRARNEIAGLELESAREIDELKKFHRALVRELTVTHDAATSSLSDQLKLLRDERAKTQQLAQDGQNEAVAFREKLERAKQQLSNMKQERDELKNRITHLEGLLTRCERERDEALRRAASQQPGASAPASRPRQYGTTLPN